MGENADNILSEDIETAEYKAKYDAACRNILANKYILAWILKDTLAEYKNENIDAIISYIEQPEVASVKVENTKLSERVSGMSDSDKNILEGEIFYDIRFSAKVPKDPKTQKETLGLIINVEEQNDFYPGYPLLKRGGYYCARMLSAERGTVFTGSEYGKIEKVVSIWICANPPKSLENTILRYGIEEEALVGTGSRPRSEYDIMSMVLINLGNPQNFKTDNAVKLLSVLLSQEMAAAEKKSILKSNFKIPMSVEVEKEVDYMCNLSDGVERRGIEKAKNAMVLKMLRAKSPIPFIAEISEFSTEKIIQIGKDNGITVEFKTD